MIYTLTLNPAVDYHIKVNELKEGSLNLAMDNNNFFWWWQRSEYF